MYYKVFSLQSQVEYLQGMFSHNYSQHTLNKLLRLLFDYPYYSYNGNHDELVNMNKIRSGGNRRQDALLVLLLRYFFLQL